MSIADINSFENENGKADVINFYLLWVKDSKRGRIRWGKFDAKIHLEDQQCAN